MKFLRLDQTNRNQFRDKICELAHQMTYPYGSDSFKIDHGSDYFAFFDRIGSPSQYIAVDGEKVVALATAVLRKVRLRQGEALKKVSYLCDLKVHPDYRGNQLTLKMAYRNFLRSFLGCQRYYAISMNGEGSKTNKVATILKKFRH